MAVEFRRNVRMDAQEEMQTARNLFVTLCSDAYGVHIRLLLSYFPDCGEDLNVARHKLIHMSKSAYIFSCGDPTLQDDKRNGSKKVLDGG